MCFAHEVGCVITIVDDLIESNLLCYRSTSMRFANLFVFEIVCCRVLVIFGEGYGSSETTMKGDEDGGYYDSGTGGSCCIFSTQPCSTHSCKK